VKSKNKPYTMRVAAIQMNSGNDVRHNLELARSLVDQAVRQRASYALLPENFAFFGSESEKKSKGEEISTLAQKFLVETAAKYNITITGGGLPMKAASGKFFNSALTANSSGIFHRYDKLHLFDATPGDNVSYLESTATEAGVLEPKLIPLAEFNLGMTICYDIRFGALYRAYAKLGAHVLAIPSAFTRLTGTAHWLTLARARAIENTCYVIAAAQTGEHYGGRSTYGHSVIIDPWGEVLQDAGERPGVIVAALDHERVKEVRAKMPSLTHDRL